MTFRLFKCYVCGSMDMELFKWDSLPLHRKENDKTKQIEKFYCSRVCSLVDNENSKC